MSFQALLKGYKLTNLSSFSSKLNPTWLFPVLLVIMDSELDPIIADKDSADNTEVKMHMNKW